MYGMCNRYNIKGTAKEISEHFNATLPTLFDIPSDDILPGHLAPGLILNGDGERELVPMQFGLAKIGAEEPFDRPWKLPFKEHRCVVPLSAFRAPCYWGDTAGTEVYFKRTDGEYLGVAGLYNVWKSTGTENLYSMMLLIRPAGKYVMDHGHHRQPLFISVAGFGAWMLPENRDAKESLAILREFAHEPPLEYRVERNMAARWKGRQKDRLADRDEQLAAITDTGPLGF
jgi:putative SOS response-associated peptidase YedK